MAEMNGVFSLRFRQPHLRDLVREVAEREHLSQNQVIERAVEADLVLRGTRLAADLRQAADVFDRLTDPVRQQMIDGSLSRFVEAESGPDPVRAEQYVPSEAERPKRGTTSRPRTRSVRG